MAASKSIWVVRTITAEVAIAIRTIITATMVICPPIAGTLTGGAITDQNTITREDIIDRAATTKGATIITRGVIRRGATTSGAHIVGADIIKAGTISGAHIGAVDIVEASGTGHVMLGLAAGTAVDPEDIAGHAVVVAGGDSRAILIAVKR